MLIGGGATHSQEDRPLQGPPSLLELLQDRVVQRRPVCLEVHRLLSLLLVRLYQEGQQDLQVQDYPTKH